MTRRLCASLTYLVMLAPVTPTVIFGAIGVTLLLKIVEVTR
jgi:hypothetical protein